LKVKVLPGELMDVASVHALQKAWPGL